jgi:hypothetical protein
MPHNNFRRASTIVLCAAFLSVFFLSACQRKGIEELVSSELLSLSLGKMEDQIDLFQFEGTMVERRNSVAMRDGWFYIANGNAGKIMVFSSYGDLIFLLYNPQTNPAPTSLGPVARTAVEGASTRGAVAYPFADIGEIAVASDKTLYVEDAIADAKAVKDAERGVILSRVILRFDRKGKALWYIGQEGIGGRPFPYVSALHVTAKDQLVVVCRLPRSWEVYWYSREGIPLYQVEIDAAHLPVQPAKGLTPVLVNIIPDLQRPLLYLPIYTYDVAADSVSSAAPAQDNVIARVYKLDLRTGQYEPSFVEFPQNPPRKERTGLKTTEIPSPPSDLLGVNASGYFSLLAYTDSNLYTLLILDPAGKVRARRHMVIEDSELTFRDLHLSSEGIIYGLLANQNRAHVSWWRSDLLLKGE